MSARTLVETYLATVWERGETDRIEEFLAPEIAATGLVSGEPLRAADVRVYVEAILSLVRKPRVELIHLIEDGDWACALLAASARSAQTGAPLRIGGQMVFRHVDGRFVEADNQFDLMGLLTQLGALPEDTLLRALSGERLT